MRVAWIGLGNMGGPMAANLVAAGHQVTGFDLSEPATKAAGDSGVVIASSIPETVSGAEVVFTMLPAGRHVEAVLNGEGGVLAHIAPGTLVVDSSTIDIATARSLHESVTAAGFRFLDAPVSGGVFGAQSGGLTFMVGGDAANLASVRELVEVMAGRIFHAGGPGSGQAAKTANNMMLGINLAALCEGSILAGRLGLDPKVFFDIASVSSGDSWALRNWYPVKGVVENAAVNRDFEGGFAINLMRKDVGLALEAGEATGTDLPFATLIVSYLDRMIELGWGGSDSAAVVKLFDGSLTAPGS
ncbi:3-hydroxyisobutyrate dehydrogenase [Nakamurella sp. UYEF19]|uniref:3-hydroxyisobutyrate dehydrogenase n=1 Tax=Nakamurella sp. UYEF19 TaxID=1756392 RepID=UPI003396AE6B